MIIATAGHVDHGKTLLVKALTGVDTDRLPEEKSRNLTIDLGFAYLPLVDGPVIGFVDVPGHEKFVRNMLCGVASIDFVLFIVAADDGPMPQTAEHLAILDILGVRHGAVALTKIDRVEPSRVDDAIEDIEILFLGTALEGAPVFPVSAVTGDGIEALRRHLEDAARSTPPRGRAGNFRLAVDRSFTVVGAGVVVTGTVFSGQTAIGDQLMISPRATPARVRGIHAQDRKAEHGVAGDRCALNLAGSGIERSSVQRGDWIVAAPAHNPVRRIDARLRVLTDEARPLANWTPVHVHLGASDVTGRVAVLEGRSIAPGESGLVQLVLDYPIGAWHGDGLIIRDQSAQRTVGGGRVVDVFPPARGRARPERLAYLRAMETTEHGAALAALLDLAETGLDLENVAVSRNLTREEAATLRDGTDMRRIVVGERAIGFAPRHWEAIRSDVVAALERWHRSHPDTAGPTAANLASTLGRRLRAATLAAILPELARDGAVVHDGLRVRLASHMPKLTAADQKVWRDVAASLEEAGLRPMTARELADGAGLDERRMASFLSRAARLGVVSQVSKSRFLTPGMARRLAGIAEALSAEAADGVVTAAAFRDRSGIGRNMTIEVLEFFDKARFTRRLGEGRVILRPPAEAFGEGADPEA
jgi:selenocysteine-specific elongation factor